MFWIGYRFFIFAFHLAISIKAIWDEKASKFLSGRINYFEKISPWLKANEASLIQIHCASLGEFELSLPLYKSLKKEFPKHNFLFSFFSPSGFEHAKIPKGEAKTYLPIDRKRLVKDFISKVNPELVIFIKYEFWFNYLNELSKQEIPYGFVNINQPYITANLRLKTAKKLINGAEFVCTSNEQSSYVLKNNQLKFTGQFADLRYSQSLHTIQEEYKVDEEFEGFLFHSQTIICGSVWKEDVSMLSSLIKKHNTFHWVIAPHEISDNLLNMIDELHSPISYFSEKRIKEGSNLLLIDTIGDLKYLYKYGHINYVGGAFKTGLHNVIEPIYAGVPIVFGPRYYNYPEANYLIKNGLAFSVNNSKDFDDLIEKTKQGSLHLGAPNTLQNIKDDLSKLTALVKEAYESRS